MRVPRIGTGLPLGCKPQSNYFVDDLGRTLTGNPEFSSKQHSDQQSFSYAVFWVARVNRIDDRSCEPCGKACGPDGIPFLSNIRPLGICGAGVERKWQCLRNV
jgi:hypothetical protein